MVVLYLPYVVGETDFVMVGNTVGLLRNLDTGIAYLVMVYGDLQLCS